MGKVCIACGAVPMAPAKSAEQPEDCPNCGGKGTVAESGKQPGEGSKPEEDKKP